jgi:hypothetical protein
MSEPTFDLAAAHRWFAVEANNAAWELVTREDRTQDEDIQLLDQAHAAAWHWRHAGGAVQAQRAAVLLANAYAAAELPEGAVLHAKRALALLDAHAGELADWDRAFTYDAAARAYAVAGTYRSASHYRDLARQAGAAIAEAEERSIFEEHFRRWSAREPA